MAKHIWSAAATTEKLSMSKEAMRYRARDIQCYNDEELYPNTPKTYSLLSDYGDKNFILERNANGEFFRVFDDSLLTTPLRLALRPNCDRKRIRIHDITLEGLNKDFFIEYVKKGLPEGYKSKYLIKCLFGNDEYWVPCDAIEKPKAGAAKLNDGHLSELVFCYVLFLMFTTRPYSNSFSISNFVDLFKKEIVDEFEKKYISNPDSKSHIITLKRPVPDVKQKIDNIHLSLDLSHGRTKLLVDGFELIKESIERIKNDSITLISNSHTLNRFMRTSYFNGFVDLIKISLIGTAETSSMKADAILSCTFNEDDTKRKKKTFTFPISLKNNVNQVAQKGFAEFLDKLERNDVVKFSKYYLGYNESDIVLLHQSLDKHIPKPSGKYGYISREAKMKALLNSIIETYNVTSQNKERRAEGFSRALKGTSEGLTKEDDLKVVAQTRLFVLGHNFTLDKSKIQKIFNNIASGKFGWTKINDALTTIKFYELSKPNAHLFQIRLKPSEKRIYFELHENITNYIR